MLTDEKIIKKSHPHFIRFLGFYFLGIIFIVLGALFFWQAIFFGVLVFVLGEIVRRAETFYILETGVAKEYHLFSTSRTFIEYNKIQDIGVSQSFLENILGIGCVDFDTSGTDKIEVSFTGVESPYEIEKIVRGQMATK